MSGRGWIRDTRRGLGCSLIGAKLSEPHTSRANGLRLFRKRITLLVLNEASESEERLRKRREADKYYLLRQRTARLAQLRRSQEQRLPSETEEQRTARLAQLRRSQEQRLSSETPEERQARLQLDSDLHRRARSISNHVPLLNQTVVQTKMKTFHNELANLEISLCNTYQEFHLRHSFEYEKCRRCNRDSCMLHSTLFK